MDGPAAARLDAGMLGAEHLAIPWPTKTEASEKIMAHGMDAGHTTLGKGCEITGKLTFDGTVQIDGRVDGEIEAQETVLVGETAVVKAQITADSIIITGTVNGDVTARRRLEIRAPGKLYGNIATPSLVVHDGVIFEGKCAMAELAAKRETTVVPLAKKDREREAVQAQAPAQEPVVLPPSKNWTNWKESRG
jgi:cytoskeletal protein CcmA (bactofilin family)